MAVLYSCFMKGVPCTIVQDGDLFFCQVADMKYSLNHGFTDEEKSLDFLMACIADACYKKYMAYKELEEISFD